MELLRACHELVNIAVKPVSALACRPKSSRRTSIGVNVDVTTWYAISSWRHRDDRSLEALSIGQCL